MKIIFIFVVDAILEVGKKITVECLLNFKKIS